jgi:hypothetical protein
MDSCKEMEISTMLSIFSVIICNLFDSNFFCSNSLIGKFDQIELFKSSVNMLGRISDLFEKHYRKAEGRLTTGGSVL